MRASLRRTRPEPGGSPLLAENERRLAAERLMARIRVGAALLYAVTASVQPGDNAGLTALLGLVLLFAAVLGILVTRTAPPRLGPLSVLFAALDSAVFLGILANNLNDPTDAVYIAGLLPVLEGALRWARPGGASVGAVVGAAVAVWTAAVEIRSGSPVVAEYLVVRAGAMVLVGWAVGSIVRNLQDQQIALQLALDASHDAMVTLDLTGRVMSANDACATTLGHDPGALVGRRFVDIVTPPVGFEVPAGDLLGSLGQMLRAELPMAMPDGSARWLEVHITPVPRLGIAFAVCRDVTLRHDRTTRLAHDASHDALTDLPNRRRLVELLEDAIAFQGPPPALLFVDLDGFKAVNDALGHEAGDDLLRLVAWRMQESTRADDVVARFAGDEFCVLLRNASSATVQAVAQRIVVALSTPFAVAGDLVSIAASVGGAVHRVGEPAEELLRRADRTMYRAKQAGGDRVDLELLTA